MADSITRHFAGLADPRSGQGRRHELTDLMAITVLAVVCGADGWAEVEDFGKAKRSWLATFLKLPHGIPSHDTFGRVFASLDPEALERCIVQWTAALARSSGGRLIAIDGKTLRRSFDAADRKAAIHMVNAWSTANALTLGQLATDAKSNEITAIPKLLELLDLRGAVVTIDAMGCQKDIAEKIVAGGGDYLLQVKANHRTLHDELKLLFDEADAAGFEDMRHARHETIEKDHGRIETRRLDSTWDTAWFADRDAWPGLRSFVRVRATRDIGGKVSTEDRFYLSSCDGRDAQALLAAARGHWGVENQLHWSLDVTFGEDHCRVRQGHAAENLARFRRLALGLLKRETSFKAGLKRKRLRCAMDHDYLLAVLGP
jgi:predicted transposase YbfD/YdcC